MISQIKIGPVIYQIEEVPRLIIDSGDGNSKWANGNIQYHKATIKIEAELPAQVKLVALWHEAIHGMIQHAGQDNPGTPDKEEIITALGYAMVDFIRDNPDLVAMTQEKIANA